MLSFLLVPSFLLSFLAIIMCQWHNTWSNLSCSILRRTEKLADLQGKADRPFIKMPRQVYWKSCLLADVHSGCFSSLGPLLNYSIIGAKSKVVLLGSAFCKELTQEPIIFQSCVTSRLKMMMTMKKIRLQPRCKSKIFFPFLKGWSMNK